MTCKQLTNFVVAIVIVTSICYFRNVICCSKSDDNESMKQIENQEHTDLRIKSDPRLKLNDKFNIVDRKKTTKVHTGNPIIYENLKLIFHNDNMKQS